MRLLIESWLMHLQGVTEDAPLWDEDDALEEAEAANAKAKPAAKKPAKKAAASTTAAADTGAGAIVPKVKKVVVKAAKGTAAAAKVGSAASNKEVLPEHRRRGHELRGHKGCGKGRKGHCCGCKGMQPRS